MSDPEKPSASIPTPTKDEWGGSDSSNNVITLTDNNFKNQISSTKPTLVMFYAPCKY